MFILLISSTVTYQHRTFNDTFIDSVACYALLMAIFSNQTTIQNKEQGSYWFDIWFTLYINSCLVLYYILYVVLFEDISHLMAIILIIFRTPFTVVYPYWMVTPHIWYVDMTSWKCLLILNHFGFLTFFVYYHGLTVMV